MHAIVYCQGVDAHLPFDVALFVVLSTIYPPRQPSQPAYLHTFGWAW